MKRNGFTLLELLIVLGIISIIMMLGSTVYSGVQKRSRDAKRKGDLNIIRSSLELYRTNYSYYPSSLDENDFKSNYLKIAPSDPKTQQGYEYTVITPIECNGLSCKYNLCTILENCTGNACNFCLGPNGEI